MELSQQIIQKYVGNILRIYGSFVQQIILYGSYARGDYREDSDIDIMVLLDLNDMEIKKYRHALSAMTYDFNMEYDLDIKPMAQSYEEFCKWLSVYPFFANVNREGVRLYEIAA